jgi:NAD(P)-dependent dehydrogenase (short-subunit alcohol dehydrogenase family)
VPNALIAGIDSAIGKFIANSLDSNNWTVFGTTRRENLSKNNKIFYCDFASQESIDKCCSVANELVPSIDLLVVAVGLLEPIGNFRNIDFDSWESGFYINCLGPLRFINKLLAQLKKQPNSMVITFAGGGINSSPKQYSSYTLSKVSLTKSMELLSSEEPNIKFISLGTGWIDTPIHNQTLNAGASAGSALAETLRRYESKEFVDINKIMEFIKWAEAESSDVITGRNFSLQNDNWSSVALREKLLADDDFYKLRRYGNDKTI